ncbi:MAG: hypothetical protein O2856_06030 [Planctomycetota bacterium]|nr:hypothetical protein [Planctomycetota bacterium]
MKKILLLVTVVSTFGMVAEAGHRSRCASAKSNCSPNACNTCVTSACNTRSGVLTRWYKAKDGTFREMMPYMDALSRAEDADDMEIQLRGVNEELTAARLSIEAIQADTAKLKSELETQNAELKKQLADEQATVAAQKERGDKAEAAYKQSVEQIASLRESGKKSDELLKTARTELKETAEERDTLKTARVELEKKLADITAAKAAAEEAVKVSQKEIERAKQEATEAKKAAVEAEAKAKDAPKPDEPKPATEEPAAADGETSGDGAPQN